MGLLLHQNSCLEPKAEEHLTYCRVFQVLRGGGIPPSEGVMRNIAGMDFLLGGESLRRSDSDHLNLFQS